MASKKMLRLSLLITLLIFVSQASATLERLLPYSSLYDGYVYYSEAVDKGNGTYSYMQGRIDFAVYDTTAGNEWNIQTGYDNPGTGQYVYAYQIFNNKQGYSEVPIQAFSVFGLDGAKMSVIAGSVGSEYPTALPDKGQDFSDSVLSDTTVTWNFSYGATDYTIGIDQYSFFLIFSSDHSWTKGGYSLDAYNPEFPVAPGDGTGEAASSNISNVTELANVEILGHGISDITSSKISDVPEPATVAILGLGALIAAAKRKRK